MRTNGEFKKVLNNCDLRDLGYCRIPYTWCNKREGLSSISERIDRFLANSQWCQLFPFPTVTHRSVAYSDHILLCVETDDGCEIRQGRKPFRLKPMWVGEERCKQVIEEVWRGDLSDGTIEEVMRKIEGCNMKFNSWNKKKFGLVYKNL
ncbi:uncharacterized protein LOC122306471 [Carya illinoinensis]|uniref:uncharacterized protein LOC122306471 n=1 Tax=Carya illinoinensis TaxID=32201 RepID=UPI001C71F124|nr:uncharacterized protein LOC122306471 [Carya illinoinensis]